MDKSKLEQLQAYEILRTEALDDIRAEGLLLRHKKTGARVVLIPCEDENKVFNIAFRTPPADSTGVPHIIEHTVLCGSREYPLKDPFVELVKGSLNTFLNAMTYPDKTMYPVASTNDTDFRNLMHVYLDAVFYPNIYREKNIFRQEGWHYEIESKDEPLRYNGVVYNEMKGVFSTPESVLERETMNILFPDTAYGTESGGDPVHIPELTYEAYLDFHRRYYHPSNSYIYLYGNLDMADALSFIDEHYLSGFERLEVDSALTEQAAFPEMIKEVREYPISDDEPEEDNTYLAMSVVTGHPLDTKEMIACEVLDYALLSAPGAPVRQALLDEGIGLDVYGEFVDGILQPYFSIVSKNASEDDADRFVRTIRRVLAEQVEKGIDRKSLLAGLNYLEFQFREADYAGYPKGLMYSIDVLDSWLYDETRPFASIKNRLAYYEELRAAIGEGFFERLIRERILDNSHAALLVLRPKKGLMQAREAETAAKLKAVKASLSSDEIERLIKETQALRDWQEEPEPQEHIDSLPVLRRSDIKKEAFRLSNEPATVKAADSEGREHLVETVFHDAPCNGIAYLELLYDVRSIPESEFPYLALLKNALMNVDTAEHGYMDLNNEINAETGGMSCGLLITDSLKVPEEYQTYFSIRSKMLAGKLGRAVSLLREVCETSSFADEKRIREIIAQTRSQLQMGMQQVGHQVAAQRANAYFSAAGAAEDSVSGIAFYRFIKDLEEHYDEKKADIRAHLERLLGTVFDKSKLLVSFTSDPEVRESYARVIGDALVPGVKNAGEIVYRKPLGNLREGFTTAGQVQFVALAGNAASREFAYKGTMAIYRQIMSYDYLWQNVRVKGGAYGCGAMIRQNGDGQFTSFRDPNLRATREVYLNVPEFLRHFSADEKQMTKYVIGTISGMDTPLTPSMLGTTSMRAYLRGTTQEELDRWRCEVLEATDEDIRALAPVVERLLEGDHFCVIGGASAIEADQELFGKIESLL